MSSIADFREWLDSSDPKIVRSLVLDAYATDRKFIKTFEKIVDADFTSVTGTAWQNLFRAEHDWGFLKNKEILLDSSLLDESSKDKLKSILHVISVFLNINWLPSIIDREKESTKSLSETWHEQLEGGAKSSELSDQAEDGWRLPWEDEASDNKDQYGNHNPLKATPRGFERDRRGQLIAKDWLDMSSLERQDQQYLTPNEVGRDNKTALAGLIIMIFVLFAVLFEMQPSEDIYEPQESNTSEELNEEIGDSSLSNLPDPNFKQELSVARKLQYGAVLICEHEPVIVKLNNLRLRAKQSNYAPHYESVATDLINKSKKQIASLKSDGKWGEYYEADECTHGFQWFDNSPEDANSAFIVVSRKCDSSSQEFYYKDKNDKIVDTKIVDTSHLQGSRGAILVSSSVDTIDTVYPGDFICN